MNYRRVRGVLTAVAFLVVAGCSGDGPKVEAPTTKVPTTVERTASEAEATVAQVASLIARHNADLRESIANVEDACDFAHAVDPCPGMGGIVLLTLTTQAQTLAIDLGAVDKPEAGQYLGAIPSEIRALTESTALAAERLGAVDSEADTPRDISRAIDDLRSELDAWGPYL